MKTLPLLITCPVCVGSGLKFDAGNIMKRKGEAFTLPSDLLCEKCQGKGKVPTEAGKEILELVKLYLPGL